MKIITDDINKYDEKWWNNLYKEWTHGEVDHEKQHYIEVSKRINGSVLDVGCGMGHFSKYVKDYTGIDWSEEAIKKAKKLYPEKTFYCASHKDITNKYEAVTLFEVFEHVENPEELVNDLKKIGKTVYVSLPEGEYSQLWVENDRELMNKHNPGATEYHYANYTWEDIKKMFPTSEQIKVDDYSILFKV